jgi:hypothetical protein
MTLSVYPNPWAAFDKNGVPCAVCPRDPEADGGVPGSYVGARVDKKHTKVLQDFAAGYVAKFGAAVAKKLAEQEHRSPIQATYYEYLGISALDPELAEKLAAKAPIEIPATKYYKERIREGALIAADKATATRCKVAGWAEPAAYFAARALSKAAVEAVEAIAEGADAATETTSDAAPADAVSAKPNKSSKKQEQTQ